MTAAIDITAAQRKTLLAILRRYIPGVLVWAYGSRVKFTARPNSDLDLVAFTSPAQRRIVSDLKDVLAESKLPFLVDLHVWDEVPEKFHEIIRKDYVVLQDVQEQTKVGMASGWREATFQQLLDEGLLEIGDGYRAQNNELGGTGPIFLRAGHVTDSHIDLAGVEHFHEHLADKVRSKMSKVGDTIITTKGNSTGRTSFVTDQLPPFVYSPHLSYWRSRDPEKLCGGFLRYWSQGQEFVEQLSGMKASTDMAPYLSLTDQRRLSITLPPPAEQKAIAAVLGTLDDKIDLNRRMNATLEAMARALFQSWFVDFDPVRAKLDGRPPAALDPATAALFPEHFQDSEAGHIPKGWPLGKVSDLATLNRGAVNPGDFPTETFDHFSLPAFDNGRTPKVELGSAIMSNKFTVTPNSVLLSKLNPHIPRIWLPDLHATRRSVCSTEFMVACSKPGESREYLFSLFTSSAFASIYGTLVTGTTGSHQRIRPESVLDMKVVIPSPSLIRAFTDIAKPMFDRINRNTDQSRTLATLRDTLLPKLLSGEIQPTRDLCQEL